MDVLNELELKLKNDELDEVRERVEGVCEDLLSLNKSALTIGTLINLGSHTLMECCLGVIVRKLNNQPDSIGELTLWLILISALSRPNVIPYNSPSRITIPSICTYVNWEGKWFKALVPHIDKFLIRSLSDGSPLIQEWIIEFLSMCTSFPTTSRTPEVIQRYKEVVRPILERVNDLYLKQAWEEGVNHFLDSLSTYPESGKEMVKYVCDGIGLGVGKDLRINMLKLIDR